MWFMVKNVGLSAAVVTVNIIKFSLQTAMKSQRRNRGTALPFLETWSQME
jgi:hypothetical protein